MLGALALPARSETLQERIERVARPLIAEKWLQSACVAVIRDGKVEVASVGSMRPGGAPPDARTVFEIGSVTKTMTAILAAQQVATGDFKIEDQVSPLLGGAKLPTFEGRAITVEDLLTHHAALPDAPPALAGKPLHLWDRFGADELMSTLGTLELGSAPGTRYAYSNTSYALMGHVLAQRTGRTYPQLLEERIFAPLGMKDSSVTPASERTVRLAPPYTPDGDPTEPFDPLVFDACGAVRSTVEDMVRFVQAQIDPPASSLGRAFEATTVPRRATGTQGTRVGLGWNVDDDGIVWHNGETDGYHSYVSFRRSSKVGVVMLANSAGRVHDGIGVAAEAYAHGAAYEPRPLPPDLPVADPHGFVGRYQLDNGRIWTVRVTDGHLRMSFNETTSVRLRQGAPDRFYDRKNFRDIRFQREDGRVVSLKLILGDDELVAKRLPESAAE
jgi:D-alanyl-D-alanine-carboxypeptidase/D-alanyl-D-alanine-endopeptidase